MQRWKILAFRKLGNNCNCKYKQMLFLTHVLLAQCPPDGTTNTTPPPSIVMPPRLSARVSMGSADRYKTPITNRPSTNFSHAPNNQVSLLQANDSDPLESLASSISSINSAIDSSQVNSVKSCLSSMAADPETQRVRRILKKIDGFERSGFISKVEKVVFSAPPSVVQWTDSGFTFNFDSPTAKQAIGKVFSRGESPHTVCLLLSIISLFPKKLTRQVSKNTCGWQVSFASIVAVVSVTVSSTVPSQTGLDSCCVLETMNNVMELELR